MFPHSRSGQNTLPLSFFVERIEFNYSCGAPLSANALHIYIPMHTLNSQAQLILAHIPIHTQKTLRSI